MLGLEISRLMYYAGRAGRGDACRYVGYAVRDVVRLSPEPFRPELRVMKVGCLMSESSAEDNVAS